MNTTQNAHKREHMRQAASTAEIWELEDDLFYVEIKSAWFDGIAGKIVAEFPTRTAANMFIESFGFSEWKQIVLRS